MQMDPDRQHPASLDHLKLLIQDLVVNPTDLSFYIGGVSEISKVSEIGEIISLILQHVLNVSREKDPGGFRNVSLEGLLREFWQSFLVQGGKEQLKEEERFLWTSLSQIRLGIVQENDEEIILSFSDNVDNRTKDYSKWIPEEIRA